jgi:hypothetical protein
LARSRWPEGSRRANVSQRRGGLEPLILATLRMAFDAETEVGIYRKKAMAEFEPAEAVNPGLDRSLAQAINRALNPIPAARFASCEEFAAALA